MLQAHERSKDSVKKPTKQWNGARCPLGTIAFESYGKAGNPLGAPIRVKKNAKVQWDGRQFISASKSDRKRASPDREKLIKQMKAINGAGSFYKGAGDKYRIQNQPSGSFAGDYKRGLINATSFGHQAIPGFKPQGYS